MAPIASSEKRARGLARDKAVNSPPTRNIGLSVTSRNNVAIRGMSDHGNYKQHCDLKRFQQFFAIVQRLPLYWAARIFESPAFRSSILLIGCSHGCELQSVGDSGRSSHLDRGKPTTDPYVAFGRQQLDPGPTPLDFMRLIDGRGEASGFAAWTGDWNAYASWLYHLCLRRQLAPSEAADVVQNVFVALPGFVRLRGSYPGAPLRPWLIRVLWN